MGTLLELGNDGGAEVTRRCVRAGKIQTSLSDLKTGGMTSRFDSPGFGGKIRRRRGARG